MVRQVGARANRHDRAARFHECFELRNGFVGGDFTHPRTILGGRRFFFGFAFERPERVVLLSTYGRNGPRDEHDHIVVFT